MVPDWGVVSEPEASPKNCGKSESKVFKMPDRLSCLILWVIIVALLVFVGYVTYQEHSNHYKKMNATNTTTSKPKFTRPSNENICNSPGCHPLETETRDTVDVGVQTDEFGNGDRPRYGTLKLTSSDSASESSK